VVFGKETARLIKQVGLEWLHFAPMLLGLIENTCGDVLLQTPLELPNLALGLDIHPIALVFIKVSSL